MYRQIFNEEYNLSFHVPKKDTCSFCEKYSHSNDDEKAAIQEVYEHHMQNKDLSRKLKEQHKERAKTEDDFIAACFDLEQVLQCPLAQTICSTIKGNFLYTISQFMILKRVMSSAICGMKQHHPVGHVK